MLFFLFVLSSIGAFSYALKRTNGNVYKSILFTIYVLAIKINLITPNVPSKLDHHQPNRQIVSRVQTVAVYNPYVSILDDHRPSGLYINKIPRSVSQHYMSDHSESVIKQLRAGSRLTDAGWLFLTIWMLQYQKSLGFQTVRQAAPPPHVKSAQSLLFGKPKSDKLFCQQASMFDPQTFEKISQSSLEVRTKQDALSRIIKEYGTLEHPKFDYIDLSLGLSATHQQLAAKTYHAPSYNLSPELYDISQDQMKAINDYGLVGYVQRGGKLPSSNFIDAYHQRLRSFYERNKSTLNLNGSYRGERAIIVHNKSKGEVVIFKADTKQLWTPSQLRPRQMEGYLETGTIGNQGSVVPAGTTPPSKTT